MKRVLQAASALFALILSVPAAQTDGLAGLHAQFANPPRQYSVRPFWFWNDKLDPAEVKRQISLMASQGVYGAYLHNRAGLDTPYLSEEYFKAIEAGLEAARENGFLFGFIDEYEWPSGEARDIWLPGLPSRVVDGHPEFRMRSIAYVERDVDGPATVRLQALPDFQCAVAAPLISDSEIDGDRMTDISAHAIGGAVHWEAPPGRWRVLAFHLQPSQGRDGGLVDLLNPSAIRRFLDLTYEQYYRRFPKHFGTTIDSTYADHEGDYGHRIAWTPALFEAFRQRKGYDLRPFLPLLAYEGGKKTPKVRCDYLDIVSELYCSSFFKQVSDWCTSHGIKISGHVWEETLHMEAAFDGDLQRIMRGWSWPGVDSLWERGRLPRDFKAAASVAHFRNTRFTCENQGLQGSDSFLDFQKMRLGTNMIAVWGANLLIPHAFNYHPHRIEWPPDWFYHQPWWKYFRHYADYARRLSFMNDVGSHVADILVFQPTESAWAQAQPAFSNRNSYIPSKWNNPLDAINSTYTDILNGLAQGRRDYDVADSYFLGEAEIRDRRLRIGDESFAALVLPPLTTIRRSSLKKIRSFFDQGGTVIAVHLLPRDSMEEGREDPFVTETIAHIFGKSAPRSSRANASSSGGRAFFIQSDLGELFRILDRSVPPDVLVTEGKKGELFYSHRRKDGIDFYWLVNDGESPRDAAVFLRAQGRPEKWDAQDATRSPLCHSSVGEGTELRLHFEPWDGFYVIFDRSIAATRDLRLMRTNLDRIAGLEHRSDGILVRGRASLANPGPAFAEAEDGSGIRYRASLELGTPLPPIEVTGNWSFTPLNTSLAAPYAERRDDPRGEALRLGWHRKEVPTSAWTRSWLSRERLTARTWEVIGPFPNEDHRGFSEPYAPERIVDLSALHSAPGGISLAWKKYVSDSYVVNLGRALEMSSARNWVTAYAYTRVYSPAPRRVQFHVTADNNAKLWVNGQNLLDLHIHPFYFEMREDFGFVRQTELKPGWNDVLLKISRCERGRSWAFIVRITDDKGYGFEDLTYDPRGSGTPPVPSVAASPTAKSTWYRIPVPATSWGVRLPGPAAVTEAWYNGEEIHADASGILRLPAGAVGTGNILALRLPGEREIPDTPLFQLGPAAMPLGSWAAAGLPYYSGSAAYEKDFSLPAEYAGKNLILDCGEIGVVAEVQVNGQPAGTRVWRPFAFDITRHVKPGRNRLRIIVTNTMENERAVENHAPQLQKMQPNGLLGPVKIKALRELELRGVRVN